MTTRVPGRRSLAMSLALVAMLAVAACSSGSGSSTGSITVSDAWVRATTETRPAAGYLVISNSSSEADALVSVSSPAFGSVQLHETVMMTAAPTASMAPMGSDSMATTAPEASSGAMAGMLGMQPVDEIPVPANGSVSLEPGGYHIMLMEPTGTVAVGDTVELTLTFRTADPITVSATVKGA